MCHIHLLMLLMPLYQILKQSDNWLWRYCISKIWGIQNVLSRISNAVAKSRSHFSGSRPRMSPGSRPRFVPDHPGYFPVRGVNCSHTSRDEPRFSHGSLARIFPANPDEPRITPDDPRIAPDDPWPSPG